MRGVFFVSAGKTARAADRVATAPKIGFQIIRVNGSPSGCGVLKGFSGKVIYEGQSTLSKNGFCLKTKGRDVPAAASFFS